MKIPPLACAFLLATPCLAAEGGTAPLATAPKDADAGKDSKTISPKLRAALEKLKLPGVKINIDQRCVDVDSRVCLREGLLELIACTKETKEHESIIVVDAKPSHIHAALLLLGAKQGNPAMQRIVDQESGRFVSIPPSGGLVDVFLVIKDSKGVDAEHPISDFIVRADENYDSGAPEGSSEQEANRKFPKDPFLFAGSVLVPNGDGPRRYICDETGDVISISTFGDEMLCLSGIHGQSNESLVWEVNGEKLPEVDSKVILRLKPRIGTQPSPESSVKPTEK